MADEVGLIVNVRTRAAPGQLDRLRADVNGAVQQGAQKAFEKPAPIKGLLNDFRTKFDPAKGFTEAAPGGVPPTKKADPMSGIFGDGGGGAGGMLGPLAALTIVGQGTFDMVKKAVGILAQASPALGASLKLIQRTLMMTLKPIGDLLASFLRPIARTMREMHRRAHQAALQKGRPGSREYAEEYYNVLLGEVRDRLSDWLSKDFKDSFLGTVQGLSLGGFVNTTGPGIVSMIMGYDLGKAVDDFLGDVGGSLQRAGMEVWNGLVGIGTWLANDVWGAIRSVGESIWNGLTGIGTWLANDVWGAIRGVGESIWNGLTGIGQWFADMIRNLLDRVIDNILSGFGLGGGGGSGGNIIDNIAQGIGDLGKSIGEIINPGGGGKWLPWFADGGYVPPTPGGRIIGVAESGEGEWIVPDSKVRGFAQSVLGGGTVVNNYLTLSGTVIGVDDLERRVKRIMDASARESRRR